jgi:hypothetical protein
MTMHPYRIISQNACTTTKEDFSQRKKDGRSEENAIGYRVKGSRRTEHAFESENTKMDPD